MKNLLFLFPFLCLFSFTNYVFAQAKNKDLITIKNNDTKVILKFNVADLLAHRYSSGLEFKINQSFSLAIEVDRLNEKHMYLESDHPWYEFLEANKKGIIIEPQIRFYPFLESLSGLHTSLAGFFGWGLYYPYDGGYLDNRDWSAKGGSLHIGYQLTIGKFVLDPFIGATLAKNGYPGPFQESRVLFPAPNGLRISAGFRLGIQF